MMYSFKFIEMNTFVMLMKGYSSLWDWAVVYSAILYLYSTVQ